MMNPDIRLLALDLDNTLLNSKKIISEENKRMLVQCERAGIHVVTASGRFFHSQIDFTDQLNPEIQNNWHVCNGGAGIYTGHSLLWRENCFAADVFQVLLKQIRRTSLFYFVDTVSMVYYENASTETASRTAKQVLKKPYVQMAAHIENIDHPVRIIFYCRNEEEVTAARLIHTNGAVSYDGGDKIVEIAPKSLNKAQALAKVCAYYDVSFKQVVAIGDDENDLQLLKTAGIGIAMPNSSNVLIKNADIIGPCDCDHDGVAEIIKRYILPR